MSTTFVGAKPYLKSAEVAELFGVNPSTVFLWVKRGKLKPRKTLGGNFRFDREQVERLMARQGVLEVALQSDRRGEDRFQYLCEVVIKVACRDGTRLLNATILNVSNHGMELEIFDPDRAVEGFVEHATTGVSVYNYSSGVLRDVIRGTVCHVHPRERSYVVGLRTDDT